MEKIPEFEENVACPSCLSTNTAACMWWPQKGEWIYACRETNLVNAYSCSDMWIESNRIPDCKLCISRQPDSRYVFPVEIDIRQKNPGYFCRECGEFPAKTKECMECDCPIDPDVRYPELGYEKWCIKCSEKWCAK